MDVLTLARIFGNFLPNDYYVAHAKDHVTNETSILLGHNKKYIGRFVAGMIDSLEVQIFKNPETTLEDVEIIEQAFGRFRSSYPNRGGDFRYVQNGDNYEDSSRYAIVQLRPVHSTGTKGKL